jgi:hypothetical protein
MGGSVGTGGATGKGGNSGLGGSTGSGGSTTGVGGSSMDAGVPPSDSARAPDGDASDGGGSADLPGGRDTGVFADSTGAPPDTLRTDTSSRCVARIRAIIPSTDSLAQLLLVAGANTQVVLHVDVVSGGPASPTWTWHGYRGSSPISSTPGTSDPAAAAFPIANEGTYTFSVTDNTTCADTVTATAVAANACPACDRSVILRAAPPPAMSIPVQSGAIGLVGSPPFSQPNVVLAKGVPVSVSPSVGGNLVNSYVRINSLAGDLVADGLADPQAGGFAALLLAMDNNRALLSYDVLVVPIDGTNGSTIAATAPQLFQSYTPDQINAAAFALSGGVTVRGGTLSSSGAAVPDARVILTNRDPRAAVLSSDLIFSSVGRGDAQGNFVLHAQLGQYWVSVSPPAGSGLAEALAPNPITFGGATTVSFQWNPMTMATLTLNATDASGVAVPDGARVRLTSSETTTVGKLTVVDATGGSTTQDAQGNVRVEGPTAAGSVTFTNLPAGAAYDVLIVPPVLGPNAATTLLTVTVPAAGASQPVPVQLVRQGRIAGKLLPAGSDWSKVNVVAYDRSVDTPEAPLAVSVNLDGSFAIGASPGRPYVVIAVPDTSSGLARTFVGPGPIEASEFSITQRVQGSMAWSAKVTDENQYGLSGTALQVFCGPTWPSCIDSTIPLAETTSEDGGAFQLALPDPSTR